MDYSTLFADFNIEETNFRKGELLAQQDEPCNRLIFLLSGAVRGEMSDPSGKIVKVEDIQAPNPLAILFLFGPNNKFPVNVIATSNVTAMVIPKDKLLKMLMSNETFLRNYLDMSGEFASRLSKKLHLMSFRTIRQKLAMYLLELSQINKTDTFRLDKTHEALAEYFGVSRQALEREIKHLTSAGFITTSGKNITLNNKQQLHHLVQF